jgi:hypothetical protein
MLEERCDERFFHIPSIADQQRFAVISSMLVGEEYEGTSDFKFGSVSILIHELHGDRNGGMFAIVFGYGKKSNKELRKGVIGSIGFVGVVEVEVGARSSFRRSERESVIDGPKRP